MHTRLVRPRPEPSAPGFRVLGSQVVSERLSGVVKFFNGAKGYGFLAVEGQPDVFLHASAIPSGLDLGEGDRVSFEIAAGQNGKGPKAVSVSLEG